MKRLAEPEMDAAILGPAMIWRGNQMVRVLVYDASRIVEILMDRDGMDHDEAWEYFDFNIECAWMGVDTPVYVYTNTDWREWDDDPEPVDLTTADK